MNYTLRSGGSSMKETEVKIRLASEFLFLISGIFLGIFGLCIPYQIASATLVTWGVVFLIIAPIMSIMKNFNK